MSKVIIINGPGGIGKSTICRRLAQRLEDCVHVGGDELRQFAPADAARFLGPGSTYRAGGALTGSYARMGARHVLFEYIFTSGSQIAAFCRELPQNIPVQLFTLWAPLELVQLRERNRPNREPLGDQLVETYSVMERALNKLGSVIFNTRPLDDIVAEIEVQLIETATVPAARYVRTHS